MHEYALPLIAIHASGSTQLFNSLDEAAQYAGSFALKHRAPQIEFVQDEQGCYARESTNRFHEAEWILRDNEGRVVDPRDLPDRPRPITVRRAKRLAWEKQRDRAIELGLAVPLLQNSLASLYGRYRWTQRYRPEEVANRSLPLEAREAGLPVDRFGRRRKIAPAPYDGREWRDNQRSWKKHRRTQWK